MFEPCSSGIGELCRVYVLSAPPPLVTILNLSPTVFGSFSSTASLPFHPYRDKFIDTLRDLTSAGAQHLGAWGECYYN